MTTPEKRPFRDQADASTEVMYKCSTCGNMYPVDQPHCDICGHDCTKDTCRIIKVSNVDF